MPKYMIQQAAHDADHLPPDAWVTVKAPIPYEAVAVHLRKRRIAPLDYETLVFYVGLKERHNLHASGTPICVTKYVVTRTAGQPAH